MENNNIKPNYRNTLSILTKLYLSIIDVIEILFITFLIVK